jgi:hypothetical protein
MTRIVTTRYRYKRPQIPLKVAAHEVGHAVARLVIDEWPDEVPGSWIDSVAVTGPLSGMTLAQPRLFASMLSIAPRTTHTIRVSAG